MRDATMWTAGEFGVVPVDRMLGNSDVVTIGGRELRVIHTPGHSPGHIVLHMPSEGLLFTGDHVLPHITPNVSAGPLGSVDPLGDYLASLDLLRDLGDILALPAHGWTFSDLDERIETLQGHHLRRLAETLGCLGSAALTTFEVANAMMWSRPLGRYPRFLQRAAIGETEAHLVRLAVTGEVQCEGESPARWSVSAKEAL
jgi:glyoxylase-like metal-dependent hydrolase (beta-lactamase superfamily II)